MSFALTGCSLLERRGQQEKQAQALEAARAEFSQRYTCPLDRLTARQLADAQAVTIALGPDYLRPPVDIAGDPGRLALWREQQSKALQPYADDLVVEVVGCDHERFYTCDTAAVTSASHDGARLEMRCSAGQYTPEGRRQES